MEEPPDDNPQQTRLGASVLDRVYSSFSGRKHAFFDRGWGPPELIEAFKELPGDVGEAAPIDILWTWERRRRGVILRRGVFTSPMADRGLPPESRRAHVLMVLPEGRARPPLYIQLAATGDQGFRRRLVTFGLPLARQGIGSLILENPYYGRRRPIDQTGVYLKQFTDLLIMGEATVREGWSLARWSREQGFGPLGVTGVSMGGHMAALVGSLIRHPVAIVPCIGMHSATPVFTEGMLSHQINWGALEGGAGGAATRRAVGAILDYSDVRRFPVPTRTEAAICVSATRDAYVGDHSIRVLERHWPGAQVQWVRAGHVRAFVAYAQTFRKAMLDAMARVGDLS